VAAAVDWEVDTGELYYVGLVLWALDCTWADFNQQASGTRGKPRGILKPAPAPTRFGAPNPQTHGVKTAPAPGLDGSKTRGFRVQTRPVAILNPGSATGYIGYI
jgi:hypothetical protein